MSEADPDSTRPRPSEGPPPGRSSAGDVDKPAVAATRTSWVVGAVPPGSGPRETEAALEEAARPFLRDGYVLVARTRADLQLERRCRTTAGGTILSAIGGLAAALVGSISPTAFPSSRTASDPIHLWVDPSGDILAARERVLGPVELRP